MDINIMNTLIKINSNNNSFKRSTSRFWFAREMRVEKQLSGSEIYNSQKMENESLSIDSLIDYFLTF